MRITQRLKSGLTIRQDFRDAARFVFFASDMPEFPFWTPGGTAFVVNFKSRPYLVTCAHVLDQGRGDEPVITNVKLGNVPVRAKRVHRVHELDGSTLDADMADVAVIAFDADVTPEAFLDTAYIAETNTVGMSEYGDSLLVHGALKDTSFISETEICPSFATLEFEDVGATSADPFLREGIAKFDNADFQTLTGLSGSPVFNSKQLRLCGMAVRGGLHDGIWRIRYVDAFDIVKLLDCVHSDEPRVTYEKSVKRRGIRR